MGFFIRRVVYGTASFLGVMTYMFLHGLPWALDAALCVSYTALMAGLALADRKAEVFSANSSRPLSQMILIHAGFMAAIIVLVRSLIFLGPYLPAEFTHLGPGRRDSWRFLVEVLSATGLAYWEKWLLFHPRPAKAGKAQDILQQALIGDASTIGSAATGVLGSQVAYASAPASTAAFVAQPAVPQPVTVNAPAPIVAEAAESTPSRGTMPAPASYQVVATAASPSYCPSGVTVVDDYEDFVNHMRQGKRPFRKPGLTVKEEYELWRAHREKARARGLTNAIRA